MTFHSTNPATEQTLQTFEEETDAQVEEALERADKTFQRHSKTTFIERADHMQRAANILDEKKEKWAQILTEEMGKTFKSAIAEVEKCAWVCRYYAQNAEEFLKDEPIKSDASQSFIRYLPIGPVLAVMPWNFPFWQVFRFAAPNLMAGNVGLLKHASNVPRSALAIQEIFEDAGFERGVFQTLLIKSDKVESILKDTRMRAATLTGSEGAGSAVASTAGKKFKKTVLELGGSDPFIVMPSADLDEAVEAAVKGRTLNNGQSCIAAKRFIIHQDIYDQFENLFITKIENLKVGNPMSDETDIGPLATAQIRKDLDKQVQDSVAAGAEVLTGAHVIEGQGYFYKPGILTNIPEDAPAYTEELFGPVAMLFKVSDLNEAIQLANATRFGLGSAIWTKEKHEIEQAVQDLDAGATFVNSVVASDPRLPFGGVKASGYGRELSKIGIHEFMNMKTISIA